MFGYIVADKSNMDKTQLVLYKQIYCGLCHVLTEKYGTVGKLSLNYDMVFLVLVLSSLYDPEISYSFRRCIIHPLNPQEYTVSEITEYAADMNILLTYYALLDKYKDEHSQRAKKSASKLEQFIPMLNEKYPDKTLVISNQLKKLSDLEKENIGSIDAPGKIFAEITKEIFCYKHDIWKNRLTRAGYALGEFIYTMDAVCDLKKDIKSGAFNPFKQTYTYLKKADFYFDILNMQVADCVNEFKLLPLERYADLIDNILYSGVWQKYNIAFRRKVEIKNGSL